MTRVDPSSEQAVITSSPVPRCSFCGRKGALLYSGLTDRLFQAPGIWRLRRCPAALCGLLWLDPCPLETEIWKAYQTYYTHGLQPEPETPQGKTGSAHKRTVMRLERAIYRLLRTPFRLLGRGFGPIEEAYRSVRYTSTPGNIRLQVRAALYTLWPERRAATDHQMMYLMPHPGARLLDLGCGDGSLLAGLQACGWRVEGLDVDPLGVESTHARGIKATLGTLPDAAFPGSSFDAIVMSHVIEHAHDPEALLLECHRVLKPGGSLILVTPNTGSLGHRLFGEAWLHLDPPRHLHLYNRFSMARLVSGIPFAACRIRTTARDASTLFHASADIRILGRHTWGSKPRILRNLWTRGLMILEALLILVRPDLGEELVVILEKGVEES